MPLVSRYHESRNERMFTTYRYRRMGYVHATRLIQNGDKKKDDRIVDPAKISPRMLQELALYYPDEYLKACRDRGLEPAVVIPRGVKNIAVLEDETQPARLRPGAAQPSGESSASLITPDLIASYSAMNADEAIAFLSEMQMDPDMQSALAVLEAMEKGGRARKSVLAIFAPADAVDETEPTA